MWGPVGMLWAGVAAVFVGAIAHRKLVESGYGWKHGWVLYVVAFVGEVGGMMTAALAFANMLLPAMPHG